MLRVLFAVAFLFLSVSAQAEKLQGIAMHGAPKYKLGFTHFDYVNVDAPKGGEMKLAAEGMFDSLNSFVLKGTAAPGIGMIYQTLMVSPEDEAFSKYGLIAQTIETPEDRSWVAFDLRPEAKWADGKPITADDVVWTFNTLMKDGHPFYRAYYASVKSAVAENPHRVKFIFNMAGNRELPLIMGELPVLPKQIYAGKDFAKTALEVPLGSGPYRVKSFDPGKRIVYERVKDWWAKDLPVAKGQYNFDTISYDLYRDETVLLEAFFAGNYDFRQENVAKNWETAYDRPPVKKGLIVKTTIPHHLPAGMQAFAYNTRRPVFADARTREALGYAFDFAWSNKQFAYGAYKRTQSYFANSELASSGMPEGRELEILKQFKGQVPDALFEKAFAVPTTNGSGTDMRANLATAKKMLEEAGWKAGKSGLLERNGEPLKFEILGNQPVFERWVLPFIGNLKKIGVVATFRVVDPAQYQKRVEDFDFDMTISTFGQSLSPGNEQRDFWGSAKAAVKGSRNIIGVKDPVVDALIEQIVAAPDRQELIYRTRALDRVLLWGNYVIPQWHISAWRVAYWNKFGKPAVTPEYGLGVPETWWYAKAP